MMEQNSQLLQCVGESANLQDLTSDILKVVLGKGCSLRFRSVCKALKARIENIPEVSINLSREGTKKRNSPVLFFVSWQDNRW
mmetsp:Transcript_31679/g.66280  ORF Transcript_31679/g.66280 Transcript_31679/m.66280 type:complete len:83 (+) Transcript_31679:32-280(+)